MTTEELGRIIRAARRAQGPRQDQLAGAAGVGAGRLAGTTQQEIPAR